MKVIQLELFPVAPRWLFLKVSTDQGISGWGEPILEGKAATVAACVEEMGDFLVGQDPRRVEDLFQTLYRGGFYRGDGITTSAISGIEQALWDIKGKALGVPVYELLGGHVREKMRVYAWIAGDNPVAAAEDAKAKITAGYTALKMNATGPMEWIENPGQIQAAEERLARIREAVGPDIGIGIDFHGRVHRAVARQLVKALEPYNPLFYEEIVLSENNEALLEIRHHTSVPIATGERLYTRWGFKELLKGGACDILQPDVSHAGGIWETRKIAAMAEAFDIALAPHCPLGPIALAACLQVDFCTPNAFIQEQSLGIHYNQGSDLLDYLVNPDGFGYADGYVPRSTAPGLGIKVNEAKVRKAAEVGHRWRNPIWRNTDGSVTEW
jgi:galactonate dehydratase